MSQAKGGKASSKQKRQKRQKRLGPQKSKQQKAVATVSSGSNELEAELLRLFKHRSEAAASTVQGAGRQGTKNSLIGNDDVFEIRGFLKREECRRIIHAAEAAGFALTNQRETRYAARRRNGRIAIDSPDVAAKVWSRCKSFFPVSVDGARPVGLSPNFRFYKYEPGDSFGMHVDDSVDHGNGAHTIFTLLVYLNGGGPDLGGGATVFYKGANPSTAKEVLRFLPTEGSALAHIHGPRCMLHEGAPVKAGIKYLMRTDVIYLCDERP